MKRGLPILIFLLCAAGRGAAQQPAPTPAAAADAPAGVTVVKFNWQRVPRRTEFDSSTYSAASQTIEDPRAGTLPQDTGVSRIPNPLGTSSVTARRDRSQVNRSATTAVSNDERSSSAAKSPASERGADDYVYQLRFKNDGARRVESVDWECVFLDPDTRKELGRHRFISPRRAKAGETLTLVAPSASPPARVVSAAALDKKRKPFDERVVVRCVAYADGTFARREGAAEADCDGLREIASRGRRQQ